MLTRLLILLFISLFLCGKNALSSGLSNYNDENRISIGKGISLMIPDYMEDAKKIYYDTSFI